MDTPSGFDVPTVSVYRGPAVTLGPHRVNLQRTFITPPSNCLDTARNQISIICSATAVPGRGTRGVPAASVREAR